MMKSISVGVLTVLALLAWSIDRSSAKVVDGPRASDSTLRRIADFLGRHGIDIRNAAASENFSTGGRPQVTLLSNFPADASYRSAGDPFSESFSAAANSGRAYLVALSHPGKARALEPTEFKRAWDKAPTSARVFVVLSGQDLAAAQVVAKGLRESGYVALLFKNGEAELPPVDVVEAGQFFRTAGQHFVIDTINARNSAAVQAEALALDSSNRSPIVASPAPPPPYRQPSANHCCRVCQYVKGVLVSCDRVMCGPQCAAAR